MMTRIIKAIGFILRKSGIFQLAYSFYFRHRSGILCYHDPTPDVFRLHADFLSQYFSFISLDELAGSRDKRKIPVNTLAVTLDDGHKDNCRLLPLFRHFAILPTIYLCTGLVGTNRAMWTTRITDKRSIKQFKNLSNQQRKSVMKKKYNFNERQEYEERSMLNHDEIALMMDNVDFQSHTRFHSVLDSCTHDELEAEIAGSYEDVQAITGKPCRHFAYPYGIYGKREKDIVQKTGYTTSRSVRWGWISRLRGPYELPCIFIPDQAGIDELVAHLCGFGLLQLAWARTYRLVTGMLKLET
ncbi:MAG: polysaccharide deacetylase family protein [Desulfobacteraceae bacterium]|nr:polysaccharide deacetylase family protein [Desulfobacteraceae bacterium]